MVNVLRRVNAENVARRFCQGFFMQEQGLFWNGKSVVGWCVARSEMNFRVRNMQDFLVFRVMLRNTCSAFRRSDPKIEVIIMKKLLLALTAIAALAVTSAFAGEAKECKKCSGADKDAQCCCKEMKGDKDKAECSKDGKECKDKDAKAAPDAEKKK